MATNFYSLLSGADKRAASPLLRVSLYKNKSKLEVSNLQTPIRLSFPLSENLLPLSYILEDVFTRKSKTKPEIIQNKDLVCLFYDESELSLSDRGCKV